MSDPARFSGSAASNAYRTVRVSGSKFRVSGMLPVSKAESSPDRAAPSNAATLVDTYVKEGRTYPIGDHTEMWVCNNGAYGKRYTLIKVQSLPTLTQDCFITKAYLYFRPSAAPAKTCFYVREMLADWDPATAIFSTVADHIGNVNIACCECTSGQYLWMKADVTDLARRWYQGTNYGVALLPDNDSNNTVRLSAPGTSSAPYFEMEYICLSGLESYWDFDTHSAGRAGQGNVNLCSGNLVFSHSDTVMNGNRMPVSISHFYNACAAYRNDFFMGYGWRCSLHHLLSVDAQDGYCYTDADGTAHFFGADNRDEDGLGLTLSVNDANVTVTDKGNNVMTFPPVSAGPVLLSSLSDAAGNTVSILSQGLRILSVTDGSGRVTSFDYQNDLLSAIRAPWQTASACTRFAYTNGMLTSVTYEDGKQSTFTYTAPDAFRLLTAAQAPDGTRVEYSYTDIEAEGGLPHFVTQAEAWAPNDENDLGGQLHAFSCGYVYGNHVTTVTDHFSGKTVRYHFNDCGNTVSTDDELGFAKYVSYDDPENPNHATSVSTPQKVVTNLLKDPSFERDSSCWVRTGNASFTRDQSHRQLGSVSMKINIAAGKQGCVEQSILLPQGEYNLSAYVSSNGPRAVLRVRGAQADHAVIAESDPVPVSDDADFCRIAVSFRISEDSTVSCMLCAETEAGSAWFDCVQLETGLTCNHFNLLQNSDFSVGNSILPDGWSKESDTSPSYYGIESLSASEAPEHLTGRAVRLIGRFDRTITFWQEVQANGSAGDRYSFGGWAKTFAREADEEHYIACRLRVLFYNGTWKIGGTVDFSAEQGNWQFGCGSAVAPVNFTKIKVLISYTRQMNSALFTNLYLYAEQFGAELGYDEKGNRVTARSLWGKDEHIEYDAFNNVTAYRAFGRSSDEKTVNHWGDTDAQKKKHLLLSSISPLGTKAEHTYDAYGNPLTTIVSDNNGHIAETVETSSAYTADGNYISSQTDARGKTLTTVTHANKGTTESVTDPNGQTVNYTYDTLRRVTKVSTQVNVNNHAENLVREYKNEYTYDVKDRLAEVRHNTDGNAQHDVVYHFGYDALGRQTTVSVGTQNLSTTEYQNDPDAPNYGTVSTVTYGNGFAVHNDYDAFNRVTGIRFGSETEPRYAFRYNAMGQAAWMKDDLLNRVTETEYDLSGRPRRIKTHENGHHLYTGEVTYDALHGNLSRFTERVGSTYKKYATTFGYDAENRPTALNYGSTHDQSTVTYDGLGRISAKGMKVNGHEYTTAFSYVPGAAAGKTTGLISAITQAGENFAYTYDDVGNIASVTHNGKVTAYSYDPLGQLIRVNDQDDLTSGTSGTTWTYEYDQGGNILSKKRYAYTEAPDLSGLTPLENDAFTYADANWRDKLTGYNGSTITYDAIGNPLNDGTWEYTWVNGRQLASMRKLDGSLNASFVYNSEGLRVQKTVNGVVTKYILHGKNITHLIRSNDELHFFYDASGSPAMVEWNNGTTTAKYAYVKNLQGDIIAILDDTGAEVVKYTYDAWGTPVSTSGTMAGTLGVLQPFRYRGYVYDDYIGLYYLRNRYYNHKIVRFISEDCILNSNMLGTNVFTYCINKPINVLDTNGTEGEEYGHYAYIWQNNTFIVDSMFLPKIKAILGEEVFIVEHWNGDDNWYHIQYLSDNKIVDGYVPSENVIVWYGFGTAGIDTFVKEYFKGFFNNSKNFLHTGTKQCQENAALRVLLHEYDKVHDNGYHYDPYICAGYDYNLEKAVRTVQSHFGLKEDGIFGKKTFEALITFLKRYGDE